LNSGYDEILMGALNPETLIHWNPESKISEAKLCSNNWNWKLL